MMDLKNLNDREDFYKVLSNTLSDYYDKSIEIVKYNNGFKGEFVQFNRINTITTRKFNYSHLKYVLKQYNVRKNIIYLIAVKIYIIILFLTRGVLATYSFDIMGVKISKYLIWPCNRTIRLFDFSENIVISLVKRGYSTNMNMNAINFRTSNSDKSFIPKIYSYKESYFTEEILDGYPLARVRNRSQYLLNVRKAITNLQNIQIGDMVDVDKKQFLELKKNQLLRITSYETLTNTESIIGKMYSQLLFLADRVQTIDSDKIPISISHGDFQSGNIWVDDKSGITYLLDWETVQKRYINYDLIVLLFNIRKNYKLKEFLFNETNNFYVDLFSELISTDITQEIKILFLYEDLVFHIINFKTTNMNIDNAIELEYLKIVDRFIYELRSRE